MICISSYQHMKHLISSVIAFLFWQKNFPSECRAWSWTAQESCAKIEGALVTSKDCSCVVFKDTSWHLNLLLVLLGNRGINSSVTTSLWMLMRCWVTCGLQFVRQTRVFSCYAKRFWHLDSVAETLLWASWGLIIQNANPRWKSLLIWLKTAWRRERCNEYILVNSSLF